MSVSERRERPAVDFQVDHALLTTSRPRDTKNPFHLAAHAAGIPLKVIPERHRFDVKVLRLVAAALRTMQPAIVETHDYKCHFMFAVARRWFDIGGDPRWIAFHHGYTRMTPAVRVYQQLDRFSLRFADRVVTLCRPFVDQLERRGVPRDRISVLTNAVVNRQAPDKQELARLKQLWGIEPGDQVIVSVGRLSAEKGHIYLVAALRELLRSTPTLRLRLILVGDGHERARLEDLASDLGNRVIFTGHQMDAWPFYFLGDVFALPSESEGSPLVLLEAMAAGRVIVASAVGGIPELVEDGISALLVAPGDPQALRSALESVLHDARQSARLRSQAAEAARLYTPQSYVRKLTTIYLETMRLHQAVRGTHT